MVEIALDRFGSAYPFGDDPNDLHDSHASAWSGDAHVHARRHFVGGRHRFPVDLHVAGTARRSRLGPRGK